MARGFGSLVFLLWGVQAFLTDTVESSHFRGEALSWRATDEPNKIDINWMVGFSQSQCDESHITDGTLIVAAENLKCQQCSQQQISTVDYQCTDYSQAENWQRGVGHTRFTIEPGLTEFDIRYATCCWISLHNGGSNAYSAEAHVDLSPHNGVINSSPVTSWMPVSRIQQGCSVTLNIPKGDPDGDVVRCRWPSIEAERGGVTPMPGALLDSNTCIVSINAVSSSLGWYAIALVIEDFSTPTAVISKSKVPLQFLVNVYSSSDACNDKPALINPSPDQGARFGLVPGQVFRTQIRARASSAQIIEIETTSPVGMTTSAISLVPSTMNEHFITASWTPSNNQTGLHVFCFNALDSDGYTSEVRCVYLTVRGWTSAQSPMAATSAASEGTTPQYTHSTALLGEVLTSQLSTQRTTQSTSMTVRPPVMMTQPPPSPSMDCSDSGMTVFIPRSMIGEALASHLHFLDSACVGSHHNATHVKIATTYDRCGTLMEVRENNVMFSNIIHDEAVPVPGSVITRDQDVKIPVQCIMDSEGIAELSFRPDISKITFREDGYGTFNFSLRLYHSNNYARPYQSVDYPVHVGMGNKLYFEARTWSEPGLQLFVQTCRATPTTNPDDFHGYTFIQDGCIRDNTVALHPSLHPDIERFDIDAFAFVGSLPKPVVYVHCDMLLCNSSDAGSRCAIGCQNGTSGSPLSLRRRHARSASGSRSYAITQGPISVEQDEGKEATSKMASVQLPVLLTTVCLLVGCVLVLGALVAVMRKRTKRLHMYEPVSTEDQEED
ncbi:uncharacterized protein LOC119739745 [Patiria miniata]|uniref:ZP domain-containing protein n=1 Tax=Patiria miniata TaxID=46514 RepID=A0A914B3W1_PATMI|nr:uncharacterized protein LOC119739745 [Patiria miniata]